MPIRYLVYTSLLTDPKGPGIVPAVIRASRTNNAVRGITGALMFDGERFCQYIEGDPDEIVRTFASIEKDPRHSRIRVLASGSASSPRFKTWSMAYVYAATPELIDSIDDPSVPAVADAFQGALTLCDVDV